MKCESPGSPILKKMAINKEYKSIKRFGARYGRRLRIAVGKIESAKRNSNKCPYCGRDKASRVAIGIWQCSKCNSKFTGRAYIIGEPRKSLKEEV